MHLQASVATIAFLVPACGKADPVAAREAEVAAILESHLAHEDALLSILERDRDDPNAAAAALDAYLAEHGAAMVELCGQRRRLESEPAALAAAMRRLEPELSRVFERRRALTERYPELMARDEVRTALATLDAL